LNISVKVDNGNVKKNNNKTVVVNSGSTIANNTGGNGSKKIGANNDGIEKTSNSKYYFGFSREMIFAVGACLVLIVILACFMMKKKNKKIRNNSLSDSMIKNQSQISDL